MSLTQRGFIKQIFEIEQKTPKFAVRQFVLQIPGAYEQLANFQLVQDRCSILDRFSPGDEVNVHFDLRGREYNGKVYTNLQAWKIEEVNQVPKGDPEVGPTPDDVPFTETEDPNATASDTDDDLPF
jgi:single-strand DNA-binding protein